jgi:hypothetical protein
LPRRQFPETWAAFSREERLRWVEAVEAAEAAERAQQEGPPIPHDDDEIQLYSEEEQELAEYELAAERRVAQEQVPVDLDLRD